MNNLKQKLFRYIYQTNKGYFDHLFIEDFIGYIPKDVREPVLKIFEENSLPLQRWILWQSHSINERSLHDTKNLQKYEGMMIYLKGLYVLADKFKSKTIKKEPIITTPHENWLDQALLGVNEYKEKYGIKNVKTNKSETAEVQDTKVDGAKSGQAKSKRTQTNKVS